MEIQQSNILLLGLLLLSGLFSGQIASKIGMPRVAAYVLTGTLFSNEFLGRFFIQYLKTGPTPLPMSFA